MQAMEERKRTAMDKEREYRERIERITNNETPLYQRYQNEYRRNVIIPQLENKK